MAIEDQTLEDQFQGIGFSLCVLRREHPVAVITAPELYGLELFVTQAFSDDACALTEDTPLKPGADDGRFGFSRFRCCRGR